MRFTPKKIIYNERGRIAILIVGMVFTAGLAVGFGIPAFAGDPVGGLDITIEQIPGGKVSGTDYNSSISNKSVGQVRMEVGDILLRYGIGGADINKVTDALEGNGVYEAELKSFLIAIGVNEKGIQEVFTKLDELGAGADSPEEQFTEGAISAPAAGATTQPAGTVTDNNNPPKTGEISAPAVGATPQPAAVNREVKRMSGKVSVPGTGDIPKQTEGCKNDRQCAAGDICFKGLCIPVPAKATGIITRINRPENAKALRDNFRENVKTTIGHVDHGKTARIAVAHGKGLRMLNRFRSAMVRFDHILGRLESRIEKFQAQGVDVSATIPLIEKAKNMSIENEAKMEELKEKYESLLLGENAGGIAKEARAIAAELKTDIENLRSIIIEIHTQTVDYNSSRSNVKL